MFWRAELAAATLPVRVAESNGAGEALDLTRLPCEKTVLDVADDMLLLLLRDGARTLQLRCRGADPFRGRVVLRYELSGLGRAERQALTLARFLALVRSGAMPAGLFRPPAAARRWRPALQALDGRLAGAAYREIAAALVGAARTDVDWRGDSDYLRARVRRLVRLGETLCDGGYRDLLR